MDREAAKQEGLSASYAGEALDALRYALPLVVERPRVFQKIGSDGWPPARAIINDGEEPPYEVELSEDPPYRYVRVIPRTVNTALNYLDAGNIAPSPTATGVERSPLGPANDRMIERGGSPRAIPVHTLSELRLVLDEAVLEEDFLRHAPQRRERSPVGIGNTNCAFNANSFHIRCAVNPSGPCEGCQHFEAK